jgi:acyl carrier protein
MISRDEIKQTIAELGNLSVDILDDDQKLTDLMVDSFAIIDLSIALQEELQIIFVQEDLIKLVTVGDLVGLVQAKLKTIEVA